MNYYKILEEGNTDQIVRNMCEYLTNMLSIDIDIDNIIYSYSIKYDEYFTMNKYCEILIHNGRKEKIEIFNSGEFSATYNSTIKYIESFFKYYNRKQIINELI